MATSVERGEALGALDVAQHAGIVEAVARRYAWDVEERNDLIQEIWFTLLQKFHTRDPAAPIRAWVIVVATTTALRVRTKWWRWRSLKQRFQSMGQANEAVEPILNDQMADWARREILEAVTELPERARMAVLLRIYEGLSVAETAERMGCAEGTVKALRNQAQKKLEPRLEALRDLWRENEL